MKLNGCFLGSVLLALSGPLHAGQVVLDGSLGRAGSVSLNAYNQFQITSDLGRQFGANLFHSFAQLNLIQGETAVFSGPSSIRNILARVTGGASTIDGTLTSTIPNANLFLLNSRGITFGPNASLEISGVFYASTADYIALSDGTRFDGKASSGTVLSAASPVAFGFLGSGPGSTLVCQGMLQNDGGISLIGGDIQVAGENGGTAQLKAAGGSIVLASMKSAGELLVDPAQVAASAAKFSQQGSIQIDGANIDATPPSGMAGGRVIIRGGKLTVEDATIRNDSQVGVSPDASEIWGIDIATAGDILFGDRALVRTTANNPSGKASGLSIAAANCTLRLGSQVTADNQGGGAGPDLRITVRGSLLTDGLIRDDNLSPSSGSGGSVSISSHDIQFEQDATGFFENYGSGQAPSLDVKADTMTFAAANSGLFSIAAGSFNTGPGASLTFEVGKLTMEKGSQILVDTFGQGNAGMIGIFGQDAIIRGQLLAQANGPEANNAREGAGGSITVHETGTLTLAGSAASISSSFLVDNGAGGGNVGLQARTIRITDGATVSAESIGIGNSDGGNVRLAATDFVVLNRAALVADAKYGEGGNVTIDVPHLVKSVDSTINVSSTFGQSGKEDLPTESFDFATVLTGFTTVVGEQPAQWAEPMEWVSTDPGGYTFLGRRRQGEAEQQRRMILGR